MAAAQISSVNCGELRIPSAPKFCSIFSNINFLKKPLKKKLEGQTQICSASCLEGHTFYYGGQWQVNSPDGFGEEAYSKKTLP